MKKNYKFVIKWIIPYLLAIIFVYIVALATSLYFLLINQVKNDLVKITNQIKEDIHVENDKWDLSLYNSDNSIPQDNPRYIITSEGFVIERSKPIHGLLDLSRFSLINQYLSPTTVPTPANETWRVLALPILSGDQPIGVILVGIYQPAEANLPDIDRQLQEVIRRLSQNITTKGEVIDISQIDGRQLPYNISFQIVNRFNKVIMQSNNTNSISRMPTYIDRSYIDNQLKGARFKEVVDNINHTKFLTLTTPLLNEKNLVSGLIVLGMPIDSVYSVVKNVILLNIGIGLVIGTSLIPIVYFLNKKIQKRIEQNIKQKPDPKSISFIKKDCKLTIDTVTIEIPYASHQYYYCLALFQKPQKKWEADELLEILGEDFGSEKWRKVYDTMVALNRKTEQLIDKLFMVKDKRYFLNPKYAQIIKFINS